MGSVGESKENQPKSLESEKSETDNGNEKSKPKISQHPLPKEVEVKHDLFEPMLMRGREKAFDDYQERINKLFMQFRAASENGLFTTRTQKTVNVEEIVPNILGHLQDAQRKLYENDFPDCESHLVRAEIRFHDAINNTSTIWRFYNVYAFHLWIYFIGMIPSVFIFYYLALYYTMPADGETLVFGQFPLLAVQAVIWGTIGGLFQDIWFLWRHVQNRDYRNTWMIQYFSAPFIGGILGAVVYIIIIAGLIVLDPETSGKPREFIVMGLAAFAGYKWDWAIKRFETLGAKFQD